MDFNDTTEEAAFRAEAKAWLEANAPTTEDLAGLDEIQAAKLWQKRKYDAGWGVHSMARGVWRPRRQRHRAGDLEPGGREVRGSRQRLRHRPRHGRTDLDGVGQRGA